MQRLGKGKGKGRVSFRGRDQDVTKGVYALAATNVFKLFHKRQYQRRESCHLHCKMNNLIYLWIYPFRVWDLVGP